MRALHICLEFTCFRTPLVRQFVDALLYRVLNSSPSICCPELILLAVPWSLGTLPSCIFLHVITPAST